MSRYSIPLLLVASLAVLTYPCAARTLSHDHSDKSLFTSPSTTWAGSCMQYAAVDSDGQITCLEEVTIQPYAIKVYVDSEGNLQSYDFAVDSYTYTFSDMQFSLPGGGKGNQGITPIKGGKGCMSVSSGSQIFLETGSKTLENGDVVNTAVQMGTVDKATLRVSCPTGNGTLKCSDTSYDYICNLIQVQ